MQLLLRRDQRATLLGSPVFVLNVRAQLTEQERRALRIYKLGRTLLYSKTTLADRGSGLLGLISRIFIYARNISITADELSGGKKIECKNILEMLSVEEQLKEAATTLKAILEAAAHFGGEEVFEI
jgi:hypothetical protein